MERLAALHSALCLAERLNGVPLSVAQWRCTPVTRDRCAARTNPSPKRLRRVDGERAMNRSTGSNREPVLSRFARHCVVAAGIAMMVAVATLSNGTGEAKAQAPTARRVPVFEVDPAWPKLPNNWVVGHVASVAVGTPQHSFLSPLAHTRRQ